MTETKQNEGAKSPHCQAAGGLFPFGEEINVFIKFDEMTRFLGRNGTGLMSGMIVERHRDHLSLAPITSRGKVGRAYLLVPLANAGAVADALEAIAARKKVAPC